MDLDMIGYRKKHFAVEIESAKSSLYRELGEISLLVTHNGSQYMGISLLPDEAWCVVDALTAYLEANGRQRSDTG